MCKEIKGNKKKKKKEEKHQQIIAYSIATVLRKRSMNVSSY